MWIPKGTADPQKNSPALSPALQWHDLHIMPLVFVRCALVLTVALVALLTRSCRSTSPGQPGRSLELCTCKNNGPFMPSFSSIFCPLTLWRFATTELTRRIPVYGVKSAELFGPYIPEVHHGPANYAKM